MIPGVTGVEKAQHEKTRDAMSCGVRVQHRCMNHEEERGIKSTETLLMIPNPANVHPQAPDTQNHRYH